MTGPTVRELVQRTVADARWFRHHARLLGPGREAARERELSDHAMKLARHLRDAGLRFRSYP